MFILQVYDAGCTLAAQLKKGFARAASTLIAEEPQCESCDVELASRLVDHYPDVFRSAQFDGLTHEYLVMTVARRIYVAEREMLPQFEQYRRGLICDYELAKSLVEPLEHHDYSASVPHRAPMR